MNKDYLECVVDSFMSSNLMRKSIPKSMWEGFIKRRIDNELALYLDHNPSKEEKNYCISYLEHNKTNLQ